MPTTPRQVRLENGLDILLQETHAAPVISTWLWYRVGSRHEVEGHTGLSHWVEHMLFKGSREFPKGAIMRAVDRLGGYVNAMTSQDFTAYYATLPNDRAELALRIEADRMTTALFDPQEVEAERTVIIAEREGQENEPEEVLAEEMAAAAFRVHPYHHQTIGWKEDLQAITREQLYAHYRRYYAPNNAVLVVAGDFATDAYLDLIRECFGPIPAGDVPPSAARQEPPQRGERRVSLRMPGSAPLVRVSYHTPPVSQADYIPLVVRAAVRSGGKACVALGDSLARRARLYRALVETQLASAVGSHYYASLDPYLLTLSATVRDGREPAAVEEALLEQITLLAREPATARELAVAIRQTQAQFAYSSESVTSQALTLGMLAMVDHHQRMGSVLGELAAVTPEDVLRVAQTYLTEDNRIVGRYLPSEEGGTEAPEAEGEVAMLCRRPRPLARQTLCYYAAPTAARGAATVGPETVTRQVLANGMTVLIQENHASPTVTINASLHAGAAHERDEQAGLAAYTASLLRRGTQRHSYQELNLILDSVGAEASFSAGHEDMGFGGDALAEDLPLLLDHLAEIVTTPTFPEEELAKLRGQYLTHLTVLESDTGYRCDQALMAALYPSGHPLARSVLGQRETQMRLTRADILGFYAAHYHPKTLILSVVGAVEAGAVLERLDRTLGRWQVAGEPARRRIPPAEMPAGVRREVVHLPAKSQVDLAWGVVGMPRVSPDYYPAMLANIVMGRLGLAGRLGDSIRDAQGLAYYVTSSLHASHGPHPWKIVAGVHPDNVERAAASILAEVQRLRDGGVSDEELDDCRSYLTGVLPLRLETNGGIADLLVAIEEYGLGLDYLTRYRDILYSVGQDAILDVVRRYLTPDRYVLAMAGTFH
ncbi:MAG: pitrilysin family protein [Chloroflexota bacterium]